MIDADLIARARDADIVAPAETLGASLKRISSTEKNGACLTGRRPDDVWPRATPRAPRSGARRFRGVQQARSEIHCLPRQPSAD